MMSNEEIIQKLKEDMELRNFSEYTKYSYLNKTKHIVYEVTLDKVLNKKQLPMLKRKKESIKF